MKNILTAGFAAAALLISCKTARTADSQTSRRPFAKGAAAQAQRAEFLKLKGTWQITSVDYDQNYRVKPFDEGADAQCFVGSQWVLIPNNYTGSYALNGNGGCPAVTQPIKFEVDNGTEFKFKKIAEGTKAKANVAGYALNLVNQTADNFSLEQNLATNGEIVKVVYNFQKVK